jgi:hypothetical protein
VSISSAVPNSVTIGWFPLSMLFYSVSILAACSISAFLMGVIIVFLSRSGGLINAITAAIMVDIFFLILSFEWLAESRYLFEAIFCLLVIILGLIFIVVFTILGTKIIFPLIIGKTEKPAG